MSRRVVCSRCHRVISKEHPSWESTIYVLCQGCLPEAHRAHIEDLSDLTTEEFDALPYGVIELDEDDRVVAYNAAESRLSRCEPQDVIGRDFFRDIAPCANVKEFAGWVHEAREVGTSAQAKLVFDFRFPHGQQIVAISLSYDKERGATLIVVEALARDSSERPSPS